MSLVITVIYPHHITKWYPNESLIYLFTTTYDYILYPGADVTKMLSKTQIQFPLIALIVKCNLHPLFPDFLINHLCNLIINTIEK